MGAIGKKKRYAESVKLTAAGGFFNFGKGGGGGGDDDGGGSKRDVTSALPPVLHPVCVLRPETYGVFRKRFITRLRFNGTWRKSRRIC